MTVLQKRKQVQDFVAKNADDRFINMVFALMQEYSNSLKPMSEKEFYARNNKSRRDIKAGRIKSHEEVKKYFLSKK